MEKDTTLKLTENQRNVLKKIIYEGRVSDTKIAEEMKISQQAVFKIREHLEEIGVIEGYAPIINFEKVGINILHYMGIEVKPILWKEFKEWEINNKLKEMPLLFELYRVPVSDITHIVVFGFKNHDHVEKFMMTMRSNYSDQFEIKWLYTFSVKNIITQSPLKLFYDQLDKNNSLSKSGFKNYNKI